jgi:hypothetical protein
MTGILLFLAIVFLVGAIPLWLICRKEKKNK